MTADFPEVKALATDSASSIFLAIGVARHGIANDRAFETWARGAVDRVGNSLLDAIQGYMIEAGFLSEEILRAQDVADEAFVDELNRLLECVRYEGNA